MSTPSPFDGRRAELAMARRCLLVGSALHAAAAVAALGGAGHPAWFVAAPVGALPLGEVALAVVGLTALLLAVVGLMVVIGLACREAWAPRVAVGLAVAGLLNAPFGTLANLVALSLLRADPPLKPRPRRGRTQAERAGSMPHL